MRQVGWWYWCDLVGRFYYNATKLRAYSHYYEVAYVGVFKIETRKYREKYRSSDKFRNSETQRASEDKV